MAVSDRIAAGENPILVVRNWRGITQVALADAAAINQGCIADLQSGRRGGSPKQLAAIAAVLKVPWVHSYFDALGRWGGAARLHTRFPLGSRRTCRREPPALAVNAPCKLGVARRSPQVEKP
jgi:hypothetical protein